MPDSSSFPLLESLLRLRGLDLKPIYTIPDAAQIFGTSKRTIQEWVRDGRLATRDLPGRGRFLCEDLEAFLQNSVRKTQKPEHGVASRPETSSGPMDRTRAKHLKRSRQAR